MFSDKGFYFAEKQIHTYVIQSLKDIITLAKISQKDREIIENDEVVKNFVLRVCPPKSLTQIKRFNKTEHFKNEYYTILMENLSQIMIFRKQVGKFHPTGWFNENTSLLNFMPLNQCNDFVFGDNYEIKKLGDNFLNRSTITKIDLSGLSSLTSIGNAFLAECDNLMSINLNGLSSLTSIGNAFLARM